MLKKTLLSIIVILVLVQLIPLEKSNPPVDKTIALDAQENVMGILRNSCYDCHSNETKWPYYSNIAPFSFFVVSHVNKGRKALNFSEWENIEEWKKVQRLKRAITTVNNGMMALPSYVSVHDDAKLNKDEKEILSRWFEEQLELIKQK
jgi:hypothetical protein